MVRYYSTMAESFFDSLEEAVKAERELLTEKEEAFNELITTIKDIYQLTAEIEQEQTAKIDEAREEIRTACEIYSEAYRCVRDKIVKAEKERKETKDSMKNMVQDVFDAYEETWGVLTEDEVRHLCDEFDLLEN
nr:MAG TPA: hypothetical protein [Caudoviricetes sp.]